MKESIVSAANRILSGPADAPDSAPGREKTCRDGLYIWTEESYAASKRSGGKVFTAPDGYIRKTPEQKLRVPREYYNRRRRRIVSRLILLVIVIMAVYIAVNYSNF